MKINSQLNELKVNGNTIITATTATGGGSIGKVNDVVDVMSLVMNELINDCIDTSHYIISHYRTLHYGDAALLSFFCFCRSTASITMQLL